jgi:hypothetical protein
MGRASAFKAVEEDGLILETTTFDYQYVLLNKGVYEPVDYGGNYKFVVNTGIELKDVRYDNRDWFNDYLNCFGNEYDENVPNINLVLVVSSNGNVFSSVYNYWKDRKFKKANRSLTLKIE